MESSLRFSFRRTIDTVLLLFFKHIMRRSFYFLNGPCSPSPDLGTVEPPSPPSGARGALIAAFSRRHPVTQQQQYNNTIILQRVYIIIM